MLHITVAADNDLANMSTINIGNSVLATPSCDAMHCPETTTYVSSTTSVNDINTSDVRVWSQGNTLIIEANEPATAQLIATTGTSTMLAVMGGHNEYNGIETGIYIVRIGSKSFKVVIRN